MGQGAGTFDVAIHNKPDLGGVGPGVYAGTGHWGRTVARAVAPTRRSGCAGGLLYTEATGPELDEVLKRGERRTPRWWSRRFNRR